MSARRVRIAALAAATGAILFGLVLPALLADVDGTWPRVGICVAVVALNVYGVLALCRLTGPPVTNDRQEQ